ncbi:hypothetical protein PZ03_09660 [Lacticaseibacillus rhamnosus]|nr:hypothetical protein PZ03_09660 [Lacticaseibacillus rhamnosus]
MKVLLVGDFQYGSGMTVYMMNTYKQLLKDNYEITCLSYSGKRDFAKVTTALGWKTQYVTRVGQNPLKHWRDWYAFSKRMAMLLMSFILIIRPRGIFCRYGWLII